MTMTPKQWAAMNHEWTQEVVAVLASEGLPWQASSCWCDQRTSARRAELTHRGTGDVRTISVSAEHTGTPALRRAEIIRQLQQGGRGGGSR